MGRCGLRKPLCSLSANWWGCVLPYSLLDLLRPSTGAYSLLGGARSWLKNGGRQEGSRQWVLPRNTTTSVCPCREPRPPHLSHLHRTLQHQQLGLALDLVRSLLFPVFWCASSKSGVPVFPRLWISCEQTL